MLLTYIPDLVDHDLNLCPGDPAQVSAVAGQQAGREPEHSNNNARPAHWAT